MALAMRVVGNNEGDGDGGKSNGDGNKVGGQATRMATKRVMMTAKRAASKQWLWQLKGQW